MLTVGLGGLLALSASAATGPFGLLRPGGLRSAAVSILRATVPRVFDAAASRTPGRLAKPIPADTGPAKPLGVAALVAAGTTYTALVDPNTSHAFPLCPLKYFTGLDCPACGCLRAIHALTQGRVIEAANHNLLFVLALPSLVFAWLAWFAASLRSANPPPTVQRPAGTHDLPAARSNLWPLGQLSARALRVTWTVVIVLVAVFTVTRNLRFPLGRWLNSA